MPQSDALVLRPADPTARKGAVLFAVIGVIGVVGLVIEVATGNIVGAVAAAVVAVAGGLLALVVVAGRSAMRVVVDATSLQIASKRIPRSEIGGLRRRPIKDAGLDVLGGDGAVLYAMPGWFDAAQEQQLAGALGVSIVEPPPPPPEEEDEEPVAST
jgi:hypothetical protein